MIRPDLVTFSDPEQIIYSSLCHKGYPSPVYAASTGRFFCLEEHMAGYWLNPNIGKCVRVETTHDAWVRDRANAESIGLPQVACDAIMKFPVTAVDEIRILAINWGLVRIREHPRYTSVQFSARPFQVKAILRAVVMAFAELKLHPDTTLVIDNLLLSDSATVGLAELEDKLAKGEPVLPKQDDMIPDVPMDHPLPDEIRRRFRENS